MEVLKKSRHKPKKGDIFCLKILKDAYHFGRVITDKLTGTFEGFFVVYIYEPVSADQVTIPRLSPCNLLIPPVFIHRLFWGDGHFLHLENKRLQFGDVLKSHCFVNSLNGRYYDENGQRLDKRIEPCGETSYHLPPGLSKLLIETLKPQYKDHEFIDLSIFEQPDSEQTELPKDHVNSEILNVEIRIFKMNKGSEDVGRDQIEDHLDKTFDAENVAVWLGSGSSVDGYSDISYDVNPGKSPRAVAIIDAAMRKFGVAEYKIIAVEDD